MMSGFLIVTSVGGAVAAGEGDVAASYEVMIQEGLPEGFPTKEMMTGILRQRAREERDREFPVAERRLRVDWTGEVPRLVDDSGAVLCDLGKSEWVKESVSSESGTCLLLKVMFRKPMEGEVPGVSQIYRHVLRIVAEPSGQMSVSRILDSPLPEENGVRRTVSELGAVSDDGRMALLNIRETTQEGTVTYSWQTWDVDKLQVSDTGLRMDHGARVP